MTEITFEDFGAGMASAMVTAVNFAEDAHFRSTLLMKLLPIFRLWKMVPA